MKRINSYGFKWLSYYKKVEDRKHIILQNKKLFYIFQTLDVVLSQIMRIAVINDVLLI